MKKTLATTLPLLLIFVFSSLAWAGLYKYQDASGKISIVDDIEKVPQEYRGQIPKEALQTKKNEKTQKPGETPGLSEAQYKNLTAPVPTAQNAQANADIQQETAPKGLLETVRRKTASGTVSGAIIKVVAAIIILILLYVVSGKIFANLGYKRLGTIITISVAAFVLIYLVRAQLKTISEKYKKTAEQVTAIQTRLKEKDQAAEKMLDEIAKGQTTDAGKSPGLPASKEDNLLQYK